MYLKTIDIQGFKSFANKIRLEFDPGLTGIVGPNGSGKSNIADAVRWVLGEQSAKQLRGSSMQDVIFAGTENRKPVSFAYVCLTFDNSDHTLKDSPEEVSVARRVYRSGESEYLMNGAPCRMRDVVELFYDTGIGREGYSIIGQGQVERILNGRPEERREMLDEAAGIMRFRKRREAARKKLESEQSSLVRVNDIISELERQVGPLEKQSEKARQYLKFKEELKKYDILNFHAENARAEEQLALAENGLETVNAQLEEARSESLGLKTSYEETGEKLAATDARLESQRTERSELSAKIESLEGNVRVLEEQAGFQRTQAEQVSERRETILSEQEERKKEQKALQEEKGGLNTRLDAVDDKLSAAKEKLEAAQSELDTMKKRAADMQKQVIELMGQKADVSAKRQHYDTLNSQITEQSSRLAEQLSEAGKEADAAEAEAVRLHAAFDELTSEQAAKRSEAEANAAAVEKAAELVNSSDHAYMEASERENTTRIRLENLSNLAERYEGFGAGVRRMMEARDRFPGMIGTVADLLNTDEAYETALETALGGALQNVVTDTEETAKDCIDHLKKSSLGRVTFLPLDSIAPRHLSQKEALRSKGVVGLASDLVKTEPEYRLLAEHLLGNVIVSEDIDSALALARRFKHDLRIVTLEGELLNRGGSITGGRYKNSSNLLGRSREIDELASELKKAENARRKCQEALEAARLQQQTAKKDRARIGIERERLDKDIISAKAAADAADLKKNDAASRKEALSLELEQLKVRLDEIRSESGLIEASVKKSDDDRSGLEKEIVAMDRRISKQEEKCADLRQKAEELNVTFHDLSQRDSFVLEGLVRCRTELEKLQAENDSLDTRAEECLKAAEAYRRQAGEVRAQIEEKRLALAGLDRALAELNGQREVQAADQKRLVEERDEVSENINRLSQEQFRLEAQKEKASDKIERSLAYLWEEYQITPSEAEAVQSDEEISAAELRRRIAALKGDIRKLGPVNVNAIEDLKEISERYEFMKGQQEDLFRAEAALRDVIADLDKGMREQFTEKFGQIRTEFDRVFRELFGGGRATMELVGSDDVLEAGVQISAQPPGKKLSNLMQMSGGEKALTAISILFAIQNLKPSPFCLLDEIEANLDDSNVDRFADYLIRLSGRSQFITITHRRGTMNAARRLYGITMQEKGVSTLVSVDLS